MNVFFRNIIFLLSAVTAFVSCSEAFIVMDKVDDAEGRIIITGTISELGSAQPLKDIRVVFQAYDAEAASLSLVCKDEVYSGNDGVYAIEAYAPGGRLRCVLTAEDMNGKYKSQTQEIIVTWSGPSYDRHSNSFVVNDCNFQLSKIQAHTDDAGSGN